MGDDQFLELVDQALESVPQEFLDKLENVSVVVEDIPTRDQLKKLGVAGMLLGLYEGVPKTKRGRYGVGPTLPDKITIFKFPILSIATSMEHLKDIVRNTVIHEIAHHFGMNEEMVRSAERARRLKRLN